MIFVWELLLWRRPWRLCQYLDFFFFPLKMKLVFVSMGGWGKVLFGDSLVYSKGHIPDAKGWEIPKHHFIHQQQWNSARRKKNSPPLLPSFIHLILILPVEFYGKSLVAAYSRAGWGSTATASQSQRQIPRDVEQDLPWPSSLVT